MEILLIDGGALYRGGAKSRFHCTRKLPDPSYERFRPIWQVKQRGPAGSIPEGDFWEFKKNFYQTP